LASRELFPARKLGNEIKWTSNCLVKISWLDEVFRDISGTEAFVWVVSLSILN
jgi:hypothetical protein